MKKRTIFVISLVVCVFFAYTTAFANGFDNPDDWYMGTGDSSSYPQGRVWRSNMIGERELSRRQDGMDIRNPIPDILSAFGPEYQSLNDHINEAVTHMISEARRARASMIAFEHEVFVSGGIVSVVIYANVSAAPSRWLVRSVNFNASTGRIVNVNQAVDMNIAPLAESILRERIRNAPGHYNEALSTSLAAQAFFVTDSRIVFLYDGLRLSSAYGGVYNVEILRSNIRTATVSRSEYRVQNNGYSLKFIRLRSVIDELGHSISYNMMDGRVDILRDGVAIINLWSGENRYIIAGASRPRTLEAAPSNFYGFTYVPITFFDQIFPLTVYSIDSADRVTFITYLG